MLDVNQERNKFYGIQGLNLTEVNSAATVNGDDDEKRVDFARCRLTRLKYMKNVLLENMTVHCGLQATSTLIRIVVLTSGF